MGGSEPAAKKPRTDGAKVGKKILNVGLQSSNVSIVLDHIITKLKAGDPILKKDILFLETIKDSIDHISPQLNSLVPQVAGLPYLVRSFNTVTAEERAAMRTAQKIGKGAEAAIHSLKAFNEDLKVKVGFAVDPNSDYACLCDGSTFVWRKKHWNILKTKTGGFKTLKEKQCELLCYFWEHMLELLMEKDKNVSWSAGWEAHIGVGKAAADNESTEEDDE